MRRLWVIGGIVLILAVAIAIFRSRFSPDLDVEPHAAQEIEKAKGR